MRERLSESEILDLVERYPLPEGVEDCVMTQQELAEAMQVSVPTVTAWITKGMPVEQEGGTGKAYELRLSACWAWRQAQKAEESLRTEKVRRAQAAMRLALIGGAEGDSVMGLDPKTRREIISAQIEHERFQRERNQLLRREDVREAFDIALTLIRDGLNAAPDIIERRFALEPKIIDALIDICDEIQAGVRDSLDGFWRDRPVRDPQKTDLFQ